MTGSLSIQQAKKLVLLSQKLPPAKQASSALNATLSAIEHLGYIQIDTISAIERAHHHTLWNRNPRYKTEHLDELLDSRQMFEYWSHAAAYLPMKDYRFSLPRKLAIKDGLLDHWYHRDEALMEMVLKRIENEGPLLARDFSGKGNSSAFWAPKPAKQALENLFLQGRLMVARRKNFQKVYDLTERVIPQDTDTSMPSPSEQSRHLITRFLQANGLGRAAEMAYLRPGTKRAVSAMLEEMASNNELLRIRVGADTYYALPDSMDLLSKPLSRSKLNILSPFDNLLIQRKRMKTLFNFDYQIECYLPAAKRRYGYFSLPILWDAQLVARMDCKADRKTSVLHINHLTLEPGLTKTDAFANALYKELTSFQQFNSCFSIQLHKSNPTSFKPILQTLFQ